VRRAALLALLAFASCGDQRLTTLRSEGSAGTGGGVPAPGDCSPTLFGFGDGTKGGLGGETKIVRTWDDLNVEVGRTEPVIIKIDGMIVGSGQASVKAHKTIIGVDAASGCDGCGLNITEGDVIVRNLVIRKVRGAGDAITISTATNVWVDHCDLSSDRDHDDDYYDGLVDVVHGSDGVTVSWTHFHDHNKTSLVGHSDGNADQDTGRLHVTYHHNWFEHTTQYGPAIRFGTLHAYDNYYLNVESAISVRLGAHALAEANHFDSVVTPLDTTEGGFILEKGPNVYVNTTGNKPTQSADVTVPYAYAPDPVEEVPELVRRCAGTGKIAF
jgi:pectate lyase